MAASPKHLAFGIGFGLLLGLIGGALVWVFTGQGALAARFGVGVGVVLAAVNAMVFGMLVMGARGRSEDRGD